MSIKRHNWLWNMKNQGQKQCQNCGLMLPIETHAKVPPCPGKPCSVGPQVEDDIACPFCGDANFDKAGLKSHLEHGDCEVYNNLESIWRI